LVRSRRQVYVHNSDGSSICDSASVATGITKVTFG
jgi:hypothetical protein